MDTLNGQIDTMFKETIYIIESDNSRRIKSSQSGLPKQIKNFLMNI